MVLAHEEVLAILLGVEGHETSHGHHVLGIALVHSHLHTHHGIGGVEHIHVLHELLLLLLIVGVVHKMLLLVHQLLIVDHLVVLEHLPTVHHVLLSVIHDLLRLLEGDVVSWLVVGLHGKRHHSGHSKIHCLLFLRSFLLFRNFLIG